MASNGRRYYDPAGKGRLVEACLEPGISMAGFALEHGLNANPLRKWVRKSQQRQYDRAVEWRAEAVAGSVGVCPGGDVPAANRATHWLDRKPACGIGTVSAAAGVDAEISDAAQSLMWVP
ncbi:Transposase [Sphingobium sp. YR768]|nr:Transposase [Sphingobium sp. YR768]